MLKQAHFHSVTLIAKCFSMPNIRKIWTCVLAAACRRLADCACESTSPRMCASMCASECAPHAAAVAVNNESRRIDRVTHERDQECIFESLARRGQFAHASARECERVNSSIARALEARKRARKRTMAIDKPRANSRTFRARLAFLFLLARR